jgi:hypothetical protein
MGVWCDSKMCSPRWPGACHCQLPDISHSIRAVNNVVGTRTPIKLLVLFRSSRLSSLFKGVEKYNVGLHKWNLAHASQLKQVFLNVIFLLTVPGTQCARLHAVASKRSRNSLV